MEQKLSQGLSKISLRKKCSNPDGSRQGQGGKGWTCDWKDTPAEGRRDHWCQCYHVVLTTAFTRFEVLVADGSHRYPKL